MSGTSLHDIYLETRARLRAEGIESHDLEARLLLKHVLKVSDVDIISGIPKSVSAQESAALDTLLDRRAGGEPLSRVFGEREFHGLPFRVTPDVLDPRPDTETLVDAALKRFADNPPARILDLGTGSGCIIVTLLHEWKQARGVAVDLSPAALAVAGENAVRNQVRDRLDLVEGDWFDAIDGQVFDLIVSNPPYIRSQDIESLAPEVKNHDPILALDGGIGGLDAYKKILNGIKKSLGPAGSCFFEIGFDQHADLARLAGESNLSVRESYRDLAGILRVVEISTGEN